MPGEGLGSKPAGVRQRRNKTSTHAVLRAPEPGQIRVPRLPLGRSWHEMAQKWWKDIWASPMAPEFHDSDIHGLFALAVLVDQFWKAENPRDQIALSAEIRLQSQRYGLSPMDRRRLQWQIEVTEDKQAEGKRRRAKQEPEPAPQAQTGPRRVDPRGVLRDVSAPAS